MEDPEILNMISILLLAWWLPAVGVGARDAGSGLFSAVVWRAGTLGLLASVACVEGPSYCRLEVSVSE